VLFQESALAFNAGVVVLCIVEAANRIEEEPDATRDVQYTLEAASEA
jgi:hypothetical protein